MRSGAAIWCEEVAGACGPKLIFALAQLLICGISARIVIQALLRVLGLSPLSHLLAAESATTATFRRSFADANDCFQVPAVHGKVRVFVAPDEFADRSPPRLNI